MLGIVTIVTVLICTQALPSYADTTERKQNARPRFNTENRIAQDGYYSESHDVVTDDGYILEVNRIPNGRFRSGSIQPGSKPVVFLMHGLQSSALSFIFLGHGGSLAYVLADAGYDVWLGNARGVMNSRRHVSLNPDNPSDKLKFFDYTYEDVALRDLPTMIDYVLRVTKQQQLDYIGHSQGGTAFLVLNSLLPEYNKKFGSAHLLAGVGFQEYFPSKVLGLAAKNTDILFAFTKKIGLYELLGPNPNTAVLACHEHDKYSPECLLESVIDVMTGLLGALETVAGASMKQYAHFGQNIRDKLFRRWNYNPLKNLWVYGCLTPPIYDISLVTVDITMHYAASDFLLDERDVLNMAKVLPNARVRRVARDSFSHFDFVISADSRYLVVDYIVKNIVARNEQR